MKRDFEFKIKLFDEYLGQGGVEKIFNAEILDDLLLIRRMSTGELDMDSVSPLAKATINTYFNSILMEQAFGGDRLFEYKTLLQKEIYFDQVNCDTVAEFDKFYEDYKSKKNILFRGVSEARYSLYNSLQRKWILDKLYNKYATYVEFLEKLIAQCREINRNVIVRYLLNNGHDPENDLAILSFLQHYGCPTPLLDWTYNLETAIYFAAEGVMEAESGIGIDNYICLYFFEEDDFNEISLKKIIKDKLYSNTDSFKPRLYEWLHALDLSDDVIAKQYTEDIVQELSVIFQGREIIRRLSKVDVLAKSPLLFFSDNSKDIRIRYYLDNNMNILNQRGAFLWNPHPTKPLEYLSSEEFHFGDTAKENRVAKCININKKLVTHIQNKLKDLGLEKKRVYPNPYELAGEIYNNVR